MDEYIGLDVSLKETAVSIRRAGKRVWRGKCPSDPQLLAALIRKHAPAPERVVFETGPLSVWFFHALAAEGVPAICIDARHAKAALDMAANKTDANDADGLAHLAEVGFYKEVRVKSFDSMLTRTLVAARTRLVRIGTELSNQIRGLMKTFGLVVPAAMGSKFEHHVHALLADNTNLGQIIRPLLEAWHAVRLRAAELGRKLLADARRNAACQLLMSIPGVGVVTATSFVSAIEEPANFKHSRSVGAFVGLRRGAISLARSTMTGISPGAATATCAGCSTRPPQSSSRAADPNAICANGDCSCEKGSASNAPQSQSPASSPSSCTAC